MWFVLIGAIEAILQRAPKGAKIIDIREGKASYSFQENYIKVSLDSIDFEQVQEIISFISKTNQIFSITKFVSFTEKYLVLAAKLNQAYKLSGNSVKCVQSLCNKAKMRALLASSNKINKLWSQVLSIEELESFLHITKQDIIIKPVDGTGSQLITRFSQNIDEIPNIIQRYQGLEVVLIEEFIIGKEYSIEAYTKAGKHQILAITEKRIDSAFIECGHLVPAALSSKREKKINEAVEAFLNIVELYEGPSHTEVMVNEKGVYIIEGHPRVGGDRIVSLVRLATGIDLVEKYLYDLAHISYPAKEKKALVASVCFYNFPEGAIYHKPINLMALEELNLDEITINLSISEVAQTPKSSYDRHCLYVVYGDSYSVCQKHMDKVNEVLQGSIKLQQKELV